MPFYFISLWSIRTSSNISCLTCFDKLFVLLNNLSTEYNVIILQKSTTNIQPFIVQCDLLHADFDTSGWKTHNIMSYCYFCCSFLRSLQSQNQTTFSLSLFCRLFWRQGVHNSSCIPLRQLSTSSFLELLKIQPPFTNRDSWSYYMYKKDTLKRLI